jgi:hypothetical protein
LFHVIIPQAVIPIFILPKGGAAMKRIAAIILIIIMGGAALLGAEETVSSTSLRLEGFYGLPDTLGYQAEDGAFVPVSYDIITAAAAGVTPDDTGRDLAGGGYGAILYLDHGVTMPFMVFDNVPLMGGNNLNFKFSAGFTPMTAIGITKIELTPIAVMKIGVTGSIATGWQSIFGDGLGVMDLATGESDPASFEGAVLRGKLDGTLQFDFAAIFPGEWNHVVMQFVPAIEYSWFSGASAGQPWRYEGDTGTNYNGFKFKTTAIIGYGMPLMLDLVGVMIETSQYIGSVAELSPMESAGGWGSDFNSVVISPLAELKFSDKNVLTILGQFSLERLFTDDTIFNKAVQNRDYSGSYWDFWRITFSYVHSF